VAALREHVGEVKTDETGISGIWDFDFKFTATGLLNVAGASGLSMPLAMERIGLKLEPRSVTVDALVVDSVAERPTPDSPDLSRRMPQLPTPAFEIASVKLSPPGVNTARQQFQQDGRFTASGVPLATLIRRAWDLRAREYLLAPTWVDSTRVDIDARPIAESVANAQIELFTLRPMLQALLVERFRIKYHIEDRPMTAHRLTADRPKLTKADPSERTRCVNSFSSTGDRGASQVGFTYTCTNVTMAQLGLLLPEYANDYVQWPVVDATGLSGGWNFAFSFARRGAVEEVRKPTGVGNDAAIEPTAALTLGEALSTQLGLRLQEEKRMMPVMIIDTLAEQPTEN